MPDSPIQSTQLPPMKWEHGVRQTVRTNVTTRYEIVGQGLTVEFVVLAGEAFYVTPTGDVTINMKDCVFPGKGTVALAPAPETEGQE